MQDGLGEMELLFKALADRTRLRLINLMGDGEICVCFLVETLRTSQPKISRHLAFLRRAGIVEARRDGKWIHYRLVDPPDERAAEVMKEVRLWLKEDAEMQHDQARLSKVCCATTLPVRLRHAPRPSVVV